MVVLPCFAFSQFKISGTVSSSTGETIAGVIVRIDNSFYGASTDANGNYVLKNISSGKHRIEASFIGYELFYDSLEVTSDATKNIELKFTSHSLSEVIVSSTRANENTATAYSTVDKKEIEKQNLGQDLPYLLNTLPSIVTTSDAGAGVGYTGLRIRGSDATRVNVTINGIPVNDAESQGTYWVDLPDLASSIDNLQVQRGVGTSTNGAGAFGGSINIQTSAFEAKPYAEINNSAGSFNTLKNTFKVGTGLMNKHFTFDARLSNIISDGFIDRASSDLQSHYLQGAYYGEKTIVKAIYFSGKEKTYQAWWGVPEWKLKGNKDSLTTHFYNNYSTYQNNEDSVNLFNSNNRTYNYYTYKNQTDNYQQDYYQLHLSHSFNSKFNANVALHYTKGQGYYEEYKNADALADYGLMDVYTPNDTITNTNLIRRKWLDNDFYGAVFSFNYNNLKNFSSTLGGGYNIYDGDHFGKVIWAEYASNSNPDANYYNDNALKKDFNAFYKFNIKPFEKLNIYGDAQIRNIDYSFLGYDVNLNNVKQKVSLIFFNPKIGVTFNPISSVDIYASYAFANKEPNRDDYVQSTPVSRPKSENLIDIEFGVRYKTGIAAVSINFYDMTYKNQLILTGEVNDVGAYNRANVVDSYRRGIEFEFGVRPIKYLEWAFNITLSENKIQKFTEFVDDYDTYTQQSFTYKNTDIAFSPNIIASNIFSIKPVKNLSFDIISKYVGDQYLDNTSNERKKLDSYFVNDLRLNYSIHLKSMREISIAIMANNILNQEYENNGYTWGYIYGGKRIQENFYYPQAGTNFLVGVSLKF